MTPQQRHNVEILVQALKSGEYKQTEGTLCRTRDNQTAYCCLGVACELAIQNGLDLPKITKPIAKGELVIYEGNTTRLPAQVVDFYGFKDCRGGFGLPYERLSLTELNDCGHPQNPYPDRTPLTFTQIANIIETELNNPETTLFI